MKDYLYLPVSEVVCLRLLMPEENLHDNILLWCGCASTPKNGKDVYNYALKTLQSTT